MTDIKKIVICDDEEDARKLIRQYIADYPQLQVVQECSNGLESVTAINNLEPDLIFLDIQMPGLSGFQVLQKIVHVPQIIFSTAFDNYALKAFDNNAVDYLLKPYTKQRFSQAVNKLLVSLPNNREGVKKLSENLQATYSAYPEKLFVETGSKLTALFVKDVIWCEAEGDYTRIHLSGKNYLSNYGIGALEQKLNPQHFVRIHRSAIINIGLVKEVVRETNGYQVVLQNETVHNVGRSYVEAIKKLVI